VDPFTSNQTKIISSPFYTIVEYISPSFLWSVIREDRISQRPSGRVLTC